MPEETQTLQESRASEQEAPDIESMENWLDGHEHRTLQHGDIVRGQVVYIDEDGLMVDVGAKSEGIVPSEDLERMDADTVASIQEGDSVLVCCITPEDRNGNILLSISQAQVARDWERAQEMYDTGELLQSKVVGHNKGGVIAYVGQVRGFVPASQLARRRRGQYYESDASQPWSKVVGEELWLKIIECDPDQNRLILSEQAAMRQRRHSMRAELLSELQEGDVVTGEVTSLADFGAFIDLGGADGLVHISELSWGRVEHPSEVLSIGDEVEVQVIKIDEKRKRIGLSKKRLEPEPWEEIDERYKLGDLVPGVVTKLTDFGAFARIDDGVEGLIHISELADRLLNHPNEVVQEGDEVMVRIIRIEPERRRIGLSLRQVQDEEQLDEDEADAEGAEFEGQSQMHEKEQERVEQAEVVLKRVADSDTG